MTPPPPCGPEDLAIKALRLTRDILAQSEEPQFPAIGQLILQRGEVLDAIGHLGSVVLADGRPGRVREALTTCGMLDETIGPRLAAHQDQLGDFLRQFKGSRALLDKYRSGADEPSGTRSRDA